MGKYFNIDILPTSCYKLLLWHFTHEVKRRGTNFQEEALQLEGIKAVSEWLTTSSRHFGLFIVGITGDGKTTLVAAMRQLMNHLKIKDPICDLGSSPFAGIWMINAKELYTMFETNRNKFSRCKETFLLAIDDFGTEDRDLSLYGNHYTPIEDLLSYRYERMLPTIITTNLPPSFIREKYGDRLADRFNEMMQVVYMPDVNFRSIE